MRRTISSLLILVGFCLPAFAASGGESRDFESQGDAAWAHRDDAARAGGVLDPGPARQAAEAYGEACAAAPDRLGACFKQIEALYFDEHFLIAERADRKLLCERLVELAEGALGVVAKRADLDLETLLEMAPEERAESLREVPDAATAHFWAAITWGMWGMSHSKLAAASHGVAPKIRDHARTLVLLDETYADGGGLRLLGRLHTATPKIPFFTGWIDRAEGLALLRRAVAVSRRDARNPLFLAEALLDTEEADVRPEALALLREVAAREPSPTAWVEERETIERAREILAELEP